MGNLFSKKSSISSKSSINDVINYCEQEEPALKNIAQMAKNTTSTEFLPSLRTLYLKSLEYVNCDNANSQLLKSQIYNLYQDLIIEKAVELLDELKEWTLPEPDPSKKQEENDQIQLDALQARIKDLCSKVGELSEITKYYTRKDTQASDILDIIKILQDNANKQLKVVSEAVDVYRARYLFGIILCNYTTGDISASEERYQNDLESYLNVETYKGCIMFSELIPLLWMTESKFWNLPEMKDKNMTSSTISNKEVELYLSTGILKQYLINLAKYYSNSFWPKYDLGENTCFRNCDYNPRYGKDNFNTVRNIISPFVDNSQIRTWGNFFKYGREVLNKLDTHHIKMLPYMAQKNNFTSSGEFMKIPETWPKYDRDIELYEAIISTANICFANCGGVNTKIRDPNNGMYIPKDIGGYTYKDLGLHSLNTTYFDQRAFILVPNDEAFNEIKDSDRTSRFVKASELNIDKWKDFKIVIDANLNDVNLKSENSNSENPNSKTNRECIYNNTGYFTDKIYNCTDKSDRIKTAEFPIIPGLSAYRIKTDKATTTETKIEVPDEEIENEKEELKEAIKEEEKENFGKSFMSIQELDYLNKNNIHDIYKIYKSKCMESFDPKINLVFGKNVMINNQEYTINPIVTKFYDDIKASLFTNTLYMSLNNKLFSSIDYLTNDGESYSTKPTITFHIYYNLVPKSLDFELMIPFNIQLKTNMTICSNDVENGCPVNDLIPMVFSYTKKGDKIIDPLFEVDDVENIKKVEVKIEDLTLKENEKESFKNKYKDECEDNSSSSDSECDMNKKETFVDKVMNFVQIKF